MNVYCILLLVSFGVGTSSSAGEGNTDPSNWMESFQNYNLVDLPIIPGTHHSALLTPAWFYTYLPWAWAKCQTMSLMNQLDNGVRFLDLRVFVDVEARDVIISHTFLSNTSLLEALIVIGEFLQLHPSEGLIVLLRRDFHFGVLTADAIALLSGIVRQSGLSIVDVPKESLGSVKVSDIAGKILLFTEEATLESNIPYLLRTQLEYRDVWRTSSMDEARDSVHDYMSKPYNHRPAAFGGVALDGQFGIWQPRHTSPGLNRWFVTNLTSSWASRKIGIVMIDFATPEILASLVQTNLDRTEREFEVVV